MSSQIINDKERGLILVVETRRWYKCHTLTWFTGETLRLAMNKLFNWIRYMQNADYGILVKSTSYSEGKLLVLYRLNDEIK